MARKRKNGDGTVRQRADGRWEGRYVIGYDDKGYPKTKNVLAKTKRECAEKLEALKAELGGIKSISDTVASYGIVTRSYASKLDAVAGNSILPDDTSVSASVTIVFELT